jgi:hypothetical protein
MSAVREGTRSLSFLRSWSGSFLWRSWCFFYFLLGSWFGGSAFAACARRSGAALGSWSTAFWCRCTALRSWCGAAYGSWLAAAGANGLAATNAFGLAATNANGLAATYTFWLAATSANWLAAFDTLWFAATVTETKCFCI